MSQLAIVSNEKKAGAGKKGRREHEINSRAGTGFPDHFAVVQQTLGNRAALRLLRSGPVQAKLTVSRPDDIYEQEADRVADQVMRMQEPVVQTKPGCPFGNGPSCGEEEGIQTKPLPISPLLRKQPIEEEELKRKTVEEEEEVLHAKNETAEPPEVSDDVERAIHTLPGGSRLPETVRSFMEPRFGTDFSGVRVHSDAGAADLARSVNAHAFTVGRHIVFGAGQYSPDSDAGKKLLAHELTHVVQQNSLDFASNSSKPVPASISRLHFGIQRYKVEDCNTKENKLQDPNTVHDAHKLASSMLTNAITRCGNTADPAVQSAAKQYFKITVPPKAADDQKRWARVKNALDTMKAANAEATYECEPKQSWWHGGCLSGNVAVSLSNIHLCPLWWTAYPGVNERASILLHEWGHKWGQGINRIFETYCWDPKYASLASDSLLKMPDAFAGFIYELHTGSQMPC